MDSEGPDQPANPLTELLGIIECISGEQMPELDFAHACLCILRMLEDTFSLGAVHFYCRSFQGGISIANPLCFVCSLFAGVMFCDAVLCHSNIIRCLGRPAFCDCDSACTWVFQYLYYLNMVGNLGYVQITYGETQDLRL